MVVDFCDYFWVSNEFLNAFFKSCFFATDELPVTQQCKLGNVLLTLCRGITRGLKISVIYLPNAEVC